MDEKNKMFVANLIGALTFTTLLADNQQTTCLNIFLIFAEIDFWHFVQIVS